MSANISCLLYSVTFYFFHISVEAKLVWNHVNSSTVIAVIPTVIISMLASNFVQLWNFGMSKLCLSATRCCSRSNTRYHTSDHGVTLQRQRDSGTPSCLIPKGSMRATGNEVTSLSLEVTVCPRASMCLFVCLSVCRKAFDWTASKRQVKSKTDPDARTHTHYLYTHTHTRLSPHG